MLQQFWVACTNSEHVRNRDEELGLTTRGVVQVTVQSEHNFQACHVFLFLSVVMGSLRKRIRDTSNRTKVASFIANFPFVWSGFETATVCFSSQTDVAYLLGGLALVEVNNHVRSHLLRWVVILAGKILVYAF